METQIFHLAKKKLKHILEPKIADLEAQMTNEEKGNGGIARAEKLSPKQRSLIAQQGGQMRWNKDKPKATHYGELEIGELKIPCAVLDNGMRVLSETGIAHSFGSRSGAQFKTKRLAKEEGRALLPIFMLSDRVKPFISKELEYALCNPIIYTVGSNVFHGFAAELLPQICDVWLSAREAKVIHGNQENRVQRAEILMRGLAHVGINALIDEVTGYQRDRAADSLSKILEQFIAKELRPWLKTFPTEFYEELCRLRKVEFAEKQNFPPYFGHITNDIIYKRLAPGVLEELKNQTPKTQKGYNRHQFHRKLSDKIGHPKLLAHLDTIVAVMKLTEDGDYEGFIKKLDRVKPKYDETFDVSIKKQD